MKIAAAAALLLFPFSSHADTLGDIRNALKALNATQPVHGSLTIEQTVSSSGKYANNNTARIATVDVAHDANGVTVTVPQPLVAKGDAAEDAIGSVRLPSVIEALNARELLTDMLDGATVAEERRVLFRTRPARQLVLHLKPKEKKSANSIQIGSVKTDDKLTLWIGDDHLPLAGDRVQSTIAGILFVHGTYSAHSTYTFTHAADRLILAQLEVTEGGAGMGQKVDKKSIQTLTLR